jgi:hypothetical protein
MNIALFSISLCLVIQIDEISIYAYRYAPSVIIQPVKNPHTNFTQLKRAVLNNGALKFASAKNLYRLLADHF